jgi:streptomycin 6-kinase
MEAEDEIAGLRFWDGDPTVRLLKADDEAGAMLLERCEPGTALRETPEPEQDVVIAALLRRLWRRPSAPDIFRPLSAMTDYWSTEAFAQRQHWPDVDLVSEGLRLFKALSHSAPGDVLLATDLHAGNVLRAQREPWLMIDPKPFVGDPAYDATQHLLNCYNRLRSDPERTIARLAELLELDHERIRLWTFARTAVAAGTGWRNPKWLALARILDA